MQRVTVAVPSHRYDILIERGLLDRAGVLCREAGLGRRGLVISDGNAGPLYADRLLRSLAREGFQATVTLVAPGERSKSAGELIRLWDALAEANLDRASFVVALGGGVVGDLAGFAAATYLRGIDVVQVPTTLLAQVDSSVGGKTGIDLAAGKNLVGAFHQPRLVLIDPDTLATLPEPEYRAGMAEVVKYGVIRDMTLFQEIEANPQAFLRHESVECVRMLAASCALKADVVAQDEREGGLRAILNYGHTVGHAVEATAGYGTYLHGEAVAIGMAAAGRLAVRRGLFDPAEAERVECLIRSLGLPVRLRESLPATRLLEHMAQDKKARDGGLRFVLATGIGAVGTYAVSWEEAAAAVDAVGAGAPDGA